MKVYVIMESWADDPFDIVMIFSSLIEAEKYKHKLEELDVDKYYSYIIETYDVF